MDKKITLNDIMRQAGLLGMHDKPKLSTEVCKMIVNGYLEINGINTLNDDAKEIYAFIIEYGMLYGVEK